MKTFFVVVEEIQVFPLPQNANTNLLKHNHKHKNTISKCPGTISQADSSKNANTHCCPGKKIQTHRQRNTNTPAKKYKTHR